MALTLFAVNNGFFDDIDVKKVGALRAVAACAITSKTQLTADLMTRIRRRRGAQQGRSRTICKKLLAKKFSHSPAPY